MNGFTRVCVREREREKGREEFIKKEGLEK